ncbi:MAG: GtrA family protein [Pseudomonadota bacterium]
MSESLSLFTRLRRFLTTGLVCLALDVLVATLLASGAGVDLRVSQIIGYGAGLSLAYVIHTVWTFNDRYTPFSATNAGRFFAIAGVILAARLGILQLLIWSSAASIAPAFALFLLAAGLAQVLNLMLLDRLLFRQ